MHRGPKYKVHESSAIMPATGSIHYRAGFGIEWNVEVWNAALNGARAELREFFTNERARTALEKATHTHGFVIIRGFQLLKDDGDRWEELFNSTAELPWHSDDSNGLVWLTQYTDAVPRNTPTSVAPTDIVNRALSNPDLYQAEKRRGLWSLISNNQRHHSNWGAISVLNLAASPGSTTEQAQTALAITREANATIPHAIYAHNWLTKRDTILVIDDSHEITQPVRTVHARFKVDQQEIAGGKVVSATNFRAFDNW